MYGKYHTKETKITNYKLGEGVFEQHLKDIHKIKKLEAGKLN